MIKPIWTYDCSILKMPFISHARTHTCTHIYKVVHLKCYKLLFLKVRILVKNVLDQRQLYILLYISSRFRWHPLSSSYCAYLSNETLDNETLIKTSDAPFQKRHACYKYNGIIIPLSNIKLIITLFLNNFTLNVFLLLLLLLLLIY